MIKIETSEPLELPQFTKFELLELIVQRQYDYPLESGALDFLYDYNYDYLVDKLEWYQAQKVEDYLSKRRDVLFEEYFNGDWRKGHEFHKIVITHRLYQISPNATQA